MAGACDAAAEPTRAAAGCQRTHRVIVDVTGRPFGRSMQPRVLCARARALCACVRDMVDADASRAGEGEASPCAWVRACVLFVLTPWCTGERGCKKILINNLI